MTLTNQSSSEYLSPLILRIYNFFATASKCPENNRPEKKEKSEWSRFVSIKVKRPHALLECKEMLIRNVSRDQYFVQSWLMLDLRKGFSSCSYLFFFLIIVSSFIKIVWKVDFSHETSGKKLKVRIYWFQGVRKSFNLEKIN